MPRKFPSREEILERLAALYDQSLSREQVADWALHIFDEHDESTGDPAAREILNRMAVADLDAWDEPYLYGPSDFKAWADELSGSSSHTPEAVDDAAVRLVNPA